MSRADEIAQGLREPGGALIGGLVVEDYLQGVADYEADRAPRGLTSASYDLGRARARELVEDEADMMAGLNRRAAESHARMLEILKDHPDVLADYERRIAEIRPFGQKEPGQ